MASELDVRLDPDWERKVCQMQAVKSELTQCARQISSGANAMSAGFRSGIRIDPKTREKIGNTPARYSSKPARDTQDSSVAIAYTANYAAQKDNCLHNTLMKAVTTNG